MALSGVKVFAQFGFSYLIKKIEKRVGPCIKMDDICDSFQSNILPTGKLI